MEIAQKYLNWNAGTDGWRTNTFALILSGLLQHSLYLPRFIFNGIKVELNINSAMEDFNWDHENKSDRESLLQSVSHRIPSNEEV